jgi:methylglutaconyl-CoA hydratase
MRSHIDSIASEYNTQGEEMLPTLKFGGAAGADETAPTRALVLASEVDSCFCAGADLKERAGFTPEEYVLLSILLDYLFNCNIDASAVVEKYG